MRLFNLDLHISVIADVKNIFHRLYPDIEITDWSVSGHTWVMGEGREVVDVVNQKTWKNLDHNMIREFHQRYDNFLQQFDGFVVTFPPAFVLLFERYNKPIFLVNAIRYETPFCWNLDVEMMGYLEQRMVEMEKKNQLVVVSNNKADLDYLQMGTGIQSHYIPSLCLYTESQYEDKRNQYVMFSKSGYPAIDNLIPSKQLGRFSWKELYHHKGIVHMPYEISTMSIFEQYSANIPLFFPTKRFLKERLSEKKMDFNGPYMKQNYPTKLEPALGVNWIDFWLDRADYYNEQEMKFITYFDSYEELSHQLKAVDTAFISKQMQSWNRVRQGEALRKWNALIKPHFKPNQYRPVKGRGQINMASEIGQQIYQLALNPRFQTFLEIGTWNGEGSTVCLMNGLMKREGGGQLWSIELYKDMFDKAKQFWSWIDGSEYRCILHLLHGRITDNGMMNREEIQSHPAFPAVKRHYELYFESDVSNYQNAPIIEGQLPAQLDVIVLDGGEFSSQSEYRLLKDTKIQR